MRSSVQSVISSRSLALQQYDEAKRNGTASGSNAVASKARAAVTTAASTKPTARFDDDWTLCGWQDEPSVPVAARVASAKLCTYQSASSPAQPAAAQYTPPSSSTGAASSSPSRRRVAVSRSSCSPARRHPQGASVPQHSKATKQPPRPAVRRLQLGEEDSFGTAAEHYRPPAVADHCIAAAATGADAAASAAVAEASSGTAIGNGTSSCTPSNGTSTACDSGTGLLPRLKTGVVQQEQQGYGLRSGQEAGCHSLPNLQQVYMGPSGREPPPCVDLDQSAAGSTAYDQGDDDVIEDDSSLYAPRCSSGGTAGLLLPTTTSRTLLRSSSTSSTSSNILALQQRLLLHQQSFASVGTSSTQASSRTSAVLPWTSACSTAGAAAASRPSSAKSMLIRGPGSAIQQGSPPGFCLHARMATTAARAQMLLTRDLSSLLTPHTPRPRATPPTAEDSNTAGYQSAAEENSMCAVAASSKQQWQQHVNALDTDSAALAKRQNLPVSAAAMTVGYDTSGGGGGVGGGSCGKVANSSRPSSATTARRPAAHTAAGAAAAGGGVGERVNVGLSTGAASLLCAAGSCSIGAGSSCSFSTSSGRPVSAARGQSLAGNNSSTSNGSGGSSKPCAAGSAAGPVLAGQVPPPPAGSLRTHHSSRGLAAAAEYTACRATVGELLQRINGHKAVAALHAAPTPAAPAARAAAAAMLPGDTACSRDSRHAGGSLPGAAASPGKSVGPNLLHQPSVMQQCVLSGEHCVSLKAYQAFQAGAASGSISSSGSITSRPGLLKSSSSGVSSSRTTLLELRATAALRKCGSSK